MGGAKENMSARDAVLGKIRRSLGVSGHDPGRRAIVIGRLDGAPKGVIPKRGQLAPAEQVDLFCRMAEKASATTIRIDAPGAVPEAVATYLRSQNLPARLRMGEDALLAGLPWRQTTISISRGASAGDDTVGISHAAAAVAESGTLVLASGPDNPTTLNFLPETHVVVLTAGDIVGDFEAAFAKLRARYGKGALPRTVNLITGPSRSGDIQQTLILGAHGPRRLHIVVVG
jgi:L-lactate dehydrogenase complex protein LldG